MRALACLAAALAADAGAATVALRTSATLAGDRVTLGDVADVTTESLDDLVRLMALPLGMAPPAHGSRRLERDAVERALRAYAPELAPRVAWDGTREVTLERSLRIVDGELILAVARAEAGRFGPGALHELRVPRDLEVPGDAVTLSARPLAVPPTLSRCLVWVDVEVDGRHARSIPVAFSVERPLAAAHDAGPERAAPSDAPGGPSVPAAPPTPAPGVSRGEWVTLTAGSDAVRLERRVQALQDGRPGDTVRVKAAGAAGVILARVAGQHDVRIDGP